MTATSVVAGVGARHAEAFILNTTTGLPDCSFNAGTLIAGTLIDGLKTFNYNNPTPQRITHYGDDKPIAQDSLPPTTIGDFTITTAKTNLALDTFTEGTKLVTLDTVVQARVGNSDKRGSEPQLFVSVFRQALDVKRGNSTFGKLRQWDQAIIPSVRIINELSGYVQGENPNNYVGIPTIVTQTPWAQTFDQTTWGATQGEYVKMETDYKPQWNVGLGNGTLSTFAVTRTPIDVAHTHAWVSGTLATVSSVNTTTKQVTLSSAPKGAGGGGVGPLGEDLVAILLEHNEAV